MLILVINCGSSSAKYQLFDIEKNVSVAKGLVERIGQEGSGLKAQKNGSVFTKKIACKDHYDAINIIVDILTDKTHGVISSRSEIDGIGHRVVHGGEEFKESTLITHKVIRSIEKFSVLAPLHNPPSLLGIKACVEILKDVPEVAVFDTAFHQTMPSKAFLYGLPFKYYKKFGIRKYGFHGTSHRFVAAEAAKKLKKPLSSLKLVTCHLGNGCSMTAVDRGQSVDTTMGFTPLEGLLMGTRSGDIDPAVVLYITEKERVSLHRVNDILNKESGLLGISGVSNDVRDLLKSASKNTENGKRSAIALEIFAYRIKKYIGAYQAAMGGLDAVIFTGGIGENNPWLVNGIARDLKKVTPKKAKFLVIPTNEELFIARDTFKIIKKRS
ncbi:MAG: acetate kinase [Candidatus Omnitrophota bacterium]